MALNPVPGIGAPNFEKGTNFTSWLDSVLLEGHMWSYSKTWDPEGVLSTVPAIVTGISGLLIGQWINHPLPKLQIVKKMAYAGLILVVFGLLWNTVFPINKSLWTSSYVLYTAGIAILCLSLLYYVIEVTDYKRGTKLFLIWGVNPMIVFFFSSIIPQTLRMIQFQNPVIATEQINLQKYLYSFWIAPLFDNPLTASLAGALIYVGIWSFILWLFYKNNLIFKV